LNPSVILFGQFWTFLQMGMWNLTRYFMREVALPLLLLFFGIAIIVGSLFFDITFGGGGGRYGGGGGGGGGRIPSTINYVVFYAAITVVNGFFLYALCRSLRPVLRARRIRKYRRPVQK
jgi:hypothetical protein